MKLGLKGILMLMFTLCMSSCASHVSEKQKVHIALSVYDVSDAFISNEIVPRLQKIAKDNGETKKYMIDIYDGEGSQTVQNAQMDDFISKKYDVIWMNLVDRTAASTIINKAKKAEIPTIFFNREPVESDLRLWSKVFYVGSQSEQSGYLQGEIVLDAFLKDAQSIDKNQDGSIQYVILEGELGHQDASLRSESLLKPFQEKNIPMERLGSEVANWRRAQGSQQMQNLLEKHSDSIEVVFSNNDEMALGAIDVLQKKKMKTKVVGIDGTKEALQAVLAGTLQGTVLNDAQAQAIEIFRITQALVTSGRPIDIVKNEVHVDFVKITPSTIHTVMEEKKLTIE